METISVTVSKEGIVKGRIGNIIFTATVFDEPSEFGIEGGRVSKLFIYRDKISSTSLIARYERGWDKNVTADIKPEYDRIRQTLESLPVEETV